MRIAEKKNTRNIDWITILIVLALFTIGLVSIASIMASPFSGDESSLSDYLEKLNLEYVQRQLVNFLVGLAGMLIMLVIDYQIYKDVIKYVYFGVVALLLILLVAGNNTRGIMAWFEIGSRAFQPGELCKIAIIVLLSKLVAASVDRDGALKSLKDIAVCLAYTAVPTVLVIRQPDFGTAFVYICIMALIFFAAKISWKYIIAAGAAACVGLPLAYFFLMSDMQKQRIDVFLHPETDPQGSGYNVGQSKISIGSGQLNGKGFFTEGTLAQLKYVPERHTDFIFSGIVEGLGFIGGTIIILLYFLLLFRWLYIASKAKDHFGAFMVIGAAGMLLAHVFENIGMTIGLMPVTGIPLPFISYGGSNLLTNMLAVGIVLNVWMRRPQRR